MASVVGTMVPISHSPPKGPFRFVDLMVQKKYLVGQGRGMTP